MNVTPDMKLPPPYLAALVFREWGDVTNAETVNLPSVEKTPTNQILWWPGVHVNNALLTNMTPKPYAMIVVLGAQNV